MIGAFDRRHDLAGWGAAAMLSAALFAGAATAALRAAPGPEGDGPVEAVALDLSVGVVPMSAVLPSAPPDVAAMTAPEAPVAPQAEAAPVLAPPVLNDAPPLHTPPVPSLEPMPQLPIADQPPVMAATAPPPPPPEVAEAPPALAQSPRPMARPDRPAEEEPRPERQRADAAPAPAAEPAPAAQETALAAPAQPAGSNQAARPAQERRVAGGQEAARYGDRVMRQIAKLRRQKAPERGVVTVGFEIGADGGLRRVAVVSSSGSLALDQVAMDHIRRAAPFPPPPEGAATRFAFEFVGR
ncbi:energy transducer TonB [Paragemmobacter ruber]|nr:energy transducer TonB [Rhodobacter ruber]